MTLPPPSDQPHGEAVRPLTDGPQRRTGPQRPPPADSRHDRMRVVTVSVTAAVVAIAFLVMTGALRGDTDASSTTTQAATTTTTSPDLLGGVLPDDTSTTTTTTLPPTFAERAPTVEGVLNVALVGEAISQVDQWLPASVEPTSADTLAPMELAAFDVSGTRLAYRAFVERADDLPQYPPGVLFAGRMAEAAPVLVAVTGFAWHLGEPGRIAVTTELPTGDGPVLLTGWFDETTGDFDIERIVTQVRPGDAVVAWADWGFLLATGAEFASMPFVVHLDQDGSPIGSVPGLLEAASREGSIVIFSLIETFWAAIASGMDVPRPPALIDDVPQGSYIGAGSLTPAEGAIALQPAIERLVSPDGTWVASQTNEGRLAVQNVFDPNVRRIISFDNLVHLIRFTADSEEMILQEFLNEPGDLMIVDRNTGARWEIPTDGRIVLDAAES